MGEIVDVGRLCERPIHAQIYLVAITGLSIHRLLSQLRQLSNYCLPLFASLIVKGVIYNE